MYLMFVKLFLIKQLKNNVVVFLPKNDKYLKIRNKMNKFNNFSEAVLKFVIPIEDQPEKNKEICPCQLDDLFTTSTKDVLNAYNDVIQPDDNVGISGDIQADVEDTITGDSNLADIITKKIDGLKTELLAIIAQDSNTIEDDLEDETTEEELSDISSEIENPEQTEEEEEEKASD